MKALVIDTLMDFTECLSVMTASQRIFSENCEKIQLELGLADHEIIQLDMAIDRCVVSLRSLTRDLKNISEK